MIGLRPSNNTQGLRTLIILVIWEIWLERNARIFKHKETACPVLISKIKDHASCWMAAGTKRLSALVA